MLLNFTKTEATDDDVPTVPPGALVNANGALRSFTLPAWGDSQNEFPCAGGAFYARAFAVDGSELTDATMSAQLYVCDLSTPTKPAWMAVSTPQTTLGMSRLITFGRHPLAAAQSAYLRITGLSSSGTIAKVVFAGNPIPGA